MVGELEKLEKPQLVYKKEKGELLIQAIIREKILFSERPTPVIKKSD